MRAVRRRESPPAQSPSPGPEERAHDGPGRRTTTAALACPLVRVGRRTCDHRALVAAVRLFICIGWAVALARRVKRRACSARLVREEAYRGARRRRAALSDVPELGARGGRAERARRVGGRPRLGEPQKEGEPK